MPPPHRDRIIADIRRRIASGEYRVGEMIPSQSQLVEMYGVSAQPVRAALDRLTWDGVLEARQGKGYFVAQGPDPTTEQP